MARLTAVQGARGLEAAYGWDEKGNLKLIHQNFTKNPVSRFFGWQVFFGQDLHTCCSEPGILLPGDQAAAVRPSLNGSFIFRTSTRKYELQRSEPRTRYRHPLGDRHLRDNVPLPGQPESHVRHRHPGRLYGRISGLPEKE